MKNKDKFTTIQQRNDAFRLWCKKHCDHDRGSNDCRNCQFMWLEAEYDEKDYCTSAIALMASRMRNGSLEMANHVYNKGLVVLNREQLEDYQKCLMMVEEIAKVSMKPIGFAEECMVCVENCRKIASGEIKLNNGDK